MNRIYAKRVMIDTIDEEIRDSKSRLYQIMDTIVPGDYYGNILQELKRLKTEMIDELTKEEAAARFTDLVTTLIQSIESTIRVEVGRCIQDERYISPPSIYQYPWNTSEHLDALNKEFNPRGLAVKYKDGYYDFRLSFKEPTKVGTLISTQVYCYLNARTKALEAAGLVVRPPTTTRSPSVQSRPIYNNVDPEWIQDR
jgi:hypothetical protein